MKKEKDILFVTEYVILEPNKDFDLSSISQEYRKEIILKSQGQAVKMIGDFSAEEVCFIFSIIYDIARELVFMNDDSIGNKSEFLIFDHNSTNALRPENINDNIYKKIIELRDKFLDYKNKNKEIEGKEKEFILDLDKILEYSKSNEVFIENLFDKIKKSEKVILKGELPILPLLFTLNISRFFADGIFYKFSSDKEFLVFN